MSDQIKEDSRTENFGVEQRYKTMEAPISSQESPIQETEEKTSEVVEEKNSKTTFNDQTNAIEVKVRKHSSQDKLVVIDGIPIENENMDDAASAPEPNLAKQSPPPAVQETAPSAPEYASGEIAEEPVITQDVPQKDANLADANIRAQKRANFAANKKKNTEGNHDSSYYTNSGVLVETEFDNDDTSFIYTGSVFDEEGAPLIGANVLVEGTDFSTTTDLNGGFVLSSPKRLPTLEVFYLGFEPSRIRPIRNDDNLSIFLAEINMLDEVVISGNTRSIEDQKIRKAKQKSTPTPIAISYKPKGGYSRWSKYLNKNLMKPEAAKSNGISGTVTLSFSILEKGEIVKIEVLKSLGFGCDEEAIRLLKEGPKWISKHKNVETIGLVNIEF